MKALKQKVTEDLALRKILEATASYTGKDFFCILVKKLAEALGTKGAWVTEVLPNPDYAQVLAMWMDNHFVKEYILKITGTPCEKVFAEKKLYHIPENVLGIYPEAADARTFKATSYLGAPLLDLDGSILGNLAVLDTRPMPEEARNVTLFKIFADRAASELRRLRAEKQLQERTEALQKEYKRKSSELEDARTLQLSMLPPPFPLNPDYEFSFSMKTASEVGGDFFDYRIDDHVLTFGIGDATGHGLGASVMVTAMKLIFSEQAATSDLIAFIKKASNSIRLMGFKKIFMTFTLGRLSGNTLELAGAGMPPAYIFRSKTRSLEQIPLKGMPLGSNTTFRYKCRRTIIEKGDIVVFMSDGLPELFNNEGKMFGYDQVSKLLLEHIHRSPKEIIDRFHSIALNWLSGKNQDDDMTFFVFKRL